MQLPHNITRYGVVYRSLKNPIAKHEASSPPSEKPQSVSQPAGIVRPSAAALGRRNVGLRGRGEWRGRGEVEEMDRGDRGDSVCVCE